MKRRMGFVSNSSSSSFIIIGDSDNNDTLDEYIPTDGKYTFGWAPEVLDYIVDRINWCMILANTGEDSNIKVDMIKQILNDIECDNEEGISTMIKMINDYNAYIDHQSNYDEKGLFNDINLLKKFILNSHSSIHIDNDNH